MKNLICLFISPFIFLSAFGQATKSESLSALETEIKALKQDACLKNASWSVCVMDIKTGKVEAQYNNEISLLPASVMKIVTTSAALALLDSSFRFETFLQYTGTIDTATGILHGNLFIKGGGDPTFGSKRFGNDVSSDSIFAEFFRSLAKKGIRAIDGRLIADESIFDDLLPQSWGWEDVGNYYGSGTCGLSINENMYRLYFDAGTSVGSPAALTGVEPPMPDIRFINNVKTAGASTGDNVYVLGGPFTYLKVLEGTVPLGKKHFDVDGAIPDPSMYCIHLFHDYLAQKGISVSGGYTTLREERWKSADGFTDTLARIDLCLHGSPILSKIICQTNLKSVNMFAETLLKMIGYKISGEGSAEAGIEAVRNYWSAHVDLKGFDMYDGCGLSRKDEITTLQLCKMLSFFYDSEQIRPFLNSLPVAGESGGMKGFLKGTVAEDNLMAKTGTMEEVRSYAGYVTNRANEDLAFAIIVNNFNCPIWEIKQKCEKLMQLIAELD